jgi:hypothetical protein
LCPSYPAHVVEQYEQEQPLVEDEAEASDGAEEVPEA